MTLLALIAALAWLYLLLGHGQFWRSGPMLATATMDMPHAVSVVIPARNEAALVGEALRSLMRQDGVGRLQVILVDDGSRDGTAAIARAVDPAISVIEGGQRPPGWAGKMWAVQQGVARAEAPWLLLTDADIVHAPGHLAALLAQAERSGADMVSCMVALRCEDLAERLLIPAFVYFFQLLYPFRWVNDTQRATAAAAGGTILIRSAALQRVGGIASIGGALIDDVALASRVKPGGRIWLGHTDMARSMRRYPHVADIWRMVARSAYVQLRHSPLLLLGTILGLALLFVVPVAVPLLPHSGTAATWLGLLAWSLLAGSFAPTLHRFGFRTWGKVLLCAALPVIAVFYMAATIGAAVAHYRGRGVVWKQRAYVERRT